MKCSNEPLGCTHTCQRQLLRSHLREDCEYVQVACSEEGCEELVLRKDVGKPTHKCVDRLMICEACGVSVKASEFEVR